MARKRQMFFSRSARGMLSGISRERARARNLAKSKIQYSWDGQMFFSGARAHGSGAELRTPTYTSNARALMIIQICRYESVLFRLV